MKQTFKKAAALLAAWQLAAFTLALPASAANIDEGFDGYLTGAQPVIAGWTFSPANAVTVEEIPDETDKSLKLARTAYATNPSAMLTFAAPLTETAVFHTRLLVSPEAAGEKAIYLKGRVAGSSVIDQIPFVFILRGGLAIYNGNVWMTVPNTAYEYGTWMNLAVTIHPQTGTFTIRKDGRDKGTYTLKTYTGWSSGGDSIDWASGVTGLTFDGGDPNNCHTLLNDFKIQSYGNLQPFQVLATSPANGDTGVSPDTSVVFELSHDIDENTFLANLTVERGGTPLPAGGFSLRQLDQNGGYRRYTVEFSPTLTPGAAYRISLGSGVRDVYGRPLSGGCTLSFTTEGKGFSLEGQPEIIVAANGFSGYPNLVAGAQVDIAVNVRSLSGSEREIRLFAGIYDETRTLRYLFSRAQAAAGHTVTPLTASFMLDGSVSEAYTLSLYLWSDDGALTPFFERIDFPAKQYFVSQTGSDGNPGTYGLPLRTLEGARDRIRTLKQADGLPPGGVTVYLRGGDYRLTQPFELFRQDSGTAGAPVAYAAYGPERVRLLGGDILEPAGFQPVTDAAVLGRLPFSAREHVVQYDLGGNGITQYGQLSAQSMYQRSDVQAMELFSDGRPMTLARWPDEGWAYTGTVSQSGGGGAVFSYGDARIEGWASLDDVWISGQLIYDWLFETIGISAIDTGAKTLTTAGAPAMGIAKNRRYYYENVLEELSAPGEYYIDRQAGMLYYYPEGGIGDSELALSSMGDALVKAQDTDYLTFRGLHIAYGRKTGIKIDGGRGNVIAACSIGSLGELGALLIGEENGIRDSLVRYTGFPAIELNGGVFASLSPAGSYAQGNEVHSYNRIIKTLNGGITVYGVGIRVSGNRIYDGPHIAVQLVGNDHLVEYNEIYNVCTQTNDSAAIYLGQSWARRGTLIRYNYIHDIGQNSASAEGVTGIYLDDQMSGTRVYGNVFFNLFRAFLLGGGCDNTFENNIMIDCERSLLIDNRGETWQAPILAPGYFLYDNLVAMPYTQEPWASAYPQLVHILTDNPGTPKRNVIRNNAAVGGSFLSVAASARAHGSIEDPWTPPFEDIGFVDRQNQNFKLRPDSVVFSYFPDFADIPFERIGPAKNQPYAPGGALYEW